MTTLPVADTILTDVERSLLAADVARAAVWVAPVWPLTSFVAVNPLGGLQELPFVEATAAARRWFSARTHLDLDSFRAEHARGVIGETELRQAIGRGLPWLAELEPLDVGRVRITGADLVHWDLLHGPTTEDAGPVPPTLADALDEILTTWCAAYVDDDHVPWPMPDRHLGFYRAWRAAATSDRRLGALVGSEGRRRLRELPEDPVAMLHRALEFHGVADADRVDAIRVLLLRTPGWAAFARWCDDWAPADRPGARLRMVDLAAVRAAMDVVAPEHLDLSAPAPVDGAAERDRRTVAAAAAFGAASASESEAVRFVISRVTDDDRRSIWLAAHEWSFRNRLLGRLAPTPPATADAPAMRPAAQLVFCIDVRSEGLRRHLEALGDYETFGFAGFFGVPVRWRPLGSETAQARCPVLVSPRHEVAEVALDDEHGYLAACATSAGLHDAFYAAKGGIASPFALAESAGWFAGPVATMRTLRPGRAVTATGSSTGSTSAPWWRRRRVPRTVPAVDAALGGQVTTGLSLDERALFAEAIVTTIGMSEFAPVVVLCGHGSDTANNPHASSLDCGACGGAPGGASARIAASILNDPDVRRALTERGIDIPADTWFVAAEHDTTADVVTIFDRDSIPDTTRSRVDELQRDLAVAGERNAQERARRLPGRPERVRDRGRDWAQVRPEWGLAGNGAFIIGPRTMTADHDLAGRCFLHSYVAERDPAGVALETIMTAPLVVAQWISAQYYFSTVDPDVFGAGDKMLHNPVGGIGVVIGQGGDLAVGLPLQSVQLGDQRAHDPLRLLAVVQAPLDRIDQIIDRNSGLRQLVDGEWIHVVARESSTERWSVRVPAGGWEPWAAGDAHAAATAPLLTPLEIS
ncbi:MAG TPA: DUF2309 domain-containing protein [Ilumatobacteraceae bacterium]|nr:DUF2309 domain-containing protein [Ilumatobacteraceae bacterium]